MAKKDKSNKDKATTVDFSTEIEGGGGGKWVKRVEEGIFYPFKVKEIKKENSSNGNPMLTIIFVGQEGKVRGRQTRDRFVLLPNSLWKLRQLLEAMGIDVPKKKIAVPHDKLIDGPVVGISFLDDEYEGKITSKPDEYCSEEDIDGGAAESDGGKKDKGGGGGKKGKKGKKKDSLEDLDLESI
jgi:hypothetical protein